MIGATFIVFEVSPFGDQIYVPPVFDGDAVKVADSSSQMVTELTVTEGIGFTVTVPEAL